MVTSMMSLSSVSVSISSSLRSHPTREQSAGIPAASRPFKRSGRRGKKPNGFRRPSNPLHRLPCVEARFGLAVPAILRKLLVAILDHDQPAPQHRLPLLEQHHPAAPAAQRNDDGRVALGGQPPALGLEEPVYALRFRLGALPRGYVRGGGCRRGAGTGGPF